MNSKALCMPLGVLFDVMFIGEICTLNSGYHFWPLEVDLLSDKIFEGMFSEFLRVDLNSDCLSSTTNSFGGGFLISKNESLDFFKAQCKTAKS